MMEGVGQVQLCVLKELETAIAVTVRLTTQDKEALGEKGWRSVCVCVCVCVCACMRACVLACVCVVVCT